MKTYTLRGSSYNVQVYCTENKIDIQEVTEEQLSFLMLIFPDQIVFRDLNDKTMNELTLFISTEKKVEFLSYINSLTTNGIIYIGSITYFNNVYKKHFTKCMISVTDEELTLLKLKFTVKEMYPQ